MRIQTRTVILLAAAMLCAADALQAQTPSNPLSANMKSSWGNIKNLLTRMAEKMPEQDYRFKPTPEMQDFGQRMAHVVAFNMRGCSTVKGQPKTVNVSDKGMPTKAEVLEAIKEANAECDEVFNSLTDADLMKIINAGRGQRLEQSFLQGLVLEHSQEMYGYMAVYLRLRGVVPPSSDRNER
jgi:DinB family protein